MAPIHLQDPARKSPGQELWLSSRLRITLASGGDVISAYPIGSDVTFNTGRRSYTINAYMAYTVITSKHSITRVHLSLSVHLDLN